MQRISIKIRFCSIIILVGDVQNIFFRVGIHVNRCQLREENYCIEANTASYFLIGEYRNTQITFNAYNDNTGITSYTCLASQVDKACKRKLETSSFGSSFKSLTDLTHDILPSDRFLSLK